jgi:type VI secretion system protein ImpA
MAVLDIEALLQPVSVQRPCGDNLEYQPPFMELQELARGKPERVIGDKVKPAQEPVWTNVCDAAVRLFSSTKDLRIAGILYLALVKIEGTAGVTAGLALLRGLLERHWQHVYPQLDPEDDLDPIFRVNSLMAALASEDALNALRQAPLVISRQFGRLTLRNHRIATGVLKVTSQDGESADPTQELARIDAIFADVSIDVLSGAAAVLNEASAHLNAIQQVLLHVAAGIPEGIRPLLADVNDIQALLHAQLTKRGVAAEPGPAAAEAVDPRASTDAARGGAIRNSTDVLAGLQRICEYYAKSEPSSPVPLLLQRAARLVDKDFMHILRDLAPAGVSEAEVIGRLENEDH